MTILLLLVVAAIIYPIIAVTLIIYAAWCWIRERPFFGRPVHNLVRRTIRAFTYQVASTNLRRSMLRRSLKARELVRVFRGDDRHRRFASFICAMPKLNKTS